MKIMVDSTEDMLKLGEHLALAPLDESVIYLQGQLGAGKTTLVRGILRGLDYIGAVKSPTYTLVESYQLPTRTVLHWDMYRLNSPEELENIGIRDYAQQSAWWLVEWPEKMESVLPPPDLIMEFLVVGEKRELQITAKTEKGEILRELL